MLPWRQLWIVLEVKSVPMHTSELMGGAVGGADLAVREGVDHSHTGLGDNLVLAFHACKHSGNVAQWGNL